MRINHNIQALNAYRNLSQNQFQVSKNLEKLSSGLRINKASDDAAGLAISEKMRTQIRGLEQAERNALDGVSLIQTAEGALSTVHSILQRMRELSVQSSNGTLEDSDREHIQSEIDQLTYELDKIADTTQFNEKKLLAGARDGRAYAKTNAEDVIKYQSAGSNRWEGELLATPVDAAKLDVEFSDIPKDGDSLEIDGFTFRFKDVPTSTTYSGGTNVFDISIQDVSLDNVLGDVKSILDAGKAASDTSLAALDSVDLVGSTLSVKTSQTTPGSGLDIAIVDKDYEANAGMDLSIDIQTGANMNEMMEINLGAMDAASLELARDENHENGGDFLPGMGALAGIDVSSQEAAQKAITKISNAITKVSSERAKLGAYQNRLEHTVTNVKAAHENLTGSESRIRDVDMAKEMTEFTKNNILNQSAQAMLAQANQLPQGVLQLLK